MTPMRGLGPTGLLLMPAARLAVLAVDALWPRMRTAGAVVTGWPPLVGLRTRIGRLPVALALPLFLIPEAISRFGWVVSAVMILHGEPLRAIGLYVATKLIAGSLALWICSATLPVLLRVPAFASAYHTVERGRKAAIRWMRRGGGGRFAALMARVRAERDIRRRLGADEAPATPADLGR